MKKVALFLILVPISLCGQQSAIDSLRRYLPAVSPEEELKVYLELANKYRGIDYDSLHFFANKALKIAQNNRDTSSEISALNIIGTAYFFTGDYNESIDAYQKGVDHALMKRDSLNLGKLYNNIGMVYSYNKDYTRSIEFLIEARKIRDVTGDPKISSTVNNLGIAYMNMSDLDPALQYFKEALQLKKQYNQRSALSNTLNNIGIILRRQEQFEEAIPYYEEAIDLAIEFEDNTKLANAYNNIGVVYDKIGNKSKALEYFEKSALIKNELGDKVGLIRSWNNMARIKVSAGRINEAFQYLNRGDSVAALSDPEIMVDERMLIRSKVNAEAGNHRVAYDFMVSAYDEKTKQLTEDRNKQIAELEVSYNTAKKEAEIERLALENELNEAKLRVSRIQTYGTALIGLLVAVSITIYFLMRFKKQQAEKLASEHQLDALRKRFIEIHEGTPALDINFEIGELNDKLHNQLTEREFEALRLSLMGKTNQEIAEELYISMSTVKFHLRNSYQKMGVQNRKEAFEYVVKTS